MKKRHLYIRKLFRLVFLFLIVAGCTNEEVQDQDNKHSDEGENHKEIVQFSDDEMKEFGIEISVASSGKLITKVSLTGEIIIPPDNLAHITPRFPGIVKKVFKHIGDRVKEGEILAIIEGNESLTDYAVKSFISGTIVEKHLSLGELVEDNTHGFVVANIDQVWALLKIYQKDLSRVRISQQVLISAGIHMPEAGAIINYISPIIDEETRTATARVVLKNTNREWKPGLFVKGIVAIGDYEADVIVPQGALFSYEGNTVIFIAGEEGFYPHPVSIGKSNELAAEIISGLESGQKYVSKGGFTIKSELQKAEFGGHAH
ncbi:efflux RND transporter periplasmic adaptor subunit [Calditrichota bacterium]